MHFFMMHMMQLILFMNQQMLSIEELKGEKDRFSSG